MPNDSANQRKIAQTLRKKEADTGHIPESRSRVASKIAKTIKESNESDENAQLPDFLRKRLNAFHHANTDAGKYCLPPDYTGTSFFKDRPNEIALRPDFKNATPSRPFADIVLEQSCGVIPAPVAQWLRDYQIEGTKFLHMKGTHQQGGILGDDMGLGKTIQVIAFLTCMFGKTGDGRDELRMREMRSLNKWYPIVLIICPVSLMDNWESELRTVNFLIVERLMISGVGGTLAAITLQVEIVKMFLRWLLLGLWK